MRDNCNVSNSKQIAMQDYHLEHARALLRNAEEIVSAAAVQDAVRQVADTLNKRFGDPHDASFPLVLGVMAGRFGLGALHDACGLDYGLSAESIPT